MGVGHNLRSVARATHVIVAIVALTTVALATLSSVGKAGLEPARLAAHDPKSCSSANSDTSPPDKLYHWQELCQKRAPGRSYFKSASISLTIKQGEGESKNPLEQAGLASERSVTEPRCGRRQIGKSCLGQASRSPSQKQQ